MKTLIYPQKPFNDVQVMFNKLEEMRLRTRMALSSLSTKHKNNNKFNDESPGRGNNNNNNRGESVFRLSNLYRVEFFVSFRQFELTFLCVDALFVSRFLCKKLFQLVSY